MTDYIIIALLVAIWFQGSRYARPLSALMDRFEHRIRRMIHGR